MYCGVSDNLSAQLTGNEEMLTCFSGDYCKAAGNAVKISDCDLRGLSNIWPAGWNQSVQGIYLACGQLFTFIDR